MYKFLVSFLFFASATISFSQIEPGRQFVGTRISLSGSNESMPDNSVYKNSSLNAELTPRYGKFIWQNIAMGGGLIMGYTNGHYKSNSTGLGSLTDARTNVMTYGLEFFTKYYKPISTDFYLTLEGGISVTHSLNYTRSVYTDWAGYTTTYNGENGNLVSGLAITPGITWFASPKLALDLSVGAAYYSNNIQFYELFSDASTVTHTYGLSFKASTISLGISYFF